MKAVKWTISILLIILSSIVTLVTIKSITAHQENSANPITWFGDHAVDNPFSKALNLRFHVTLIPTNLLMSKPSTVTG